jgi:hypothetical protein
MNSFLSPWQRAGMVLFVAAAASTSAFAQASEPGRGRQMAGELQKRFSAADANHDGRLTRDEAKNGMPFVYKHFDEIDTGKSGSLSMADIGAFFRDKAGARKAGS